MSGKKSGMKEVIESTNLEKQLTRHHEGDSDYTHQGTGSSKKVLIASVCLTLGYAVIEVIGGFLSNSLALLSDAGTGTPYDGARPHYLLDIDNAALLDVLIPVLAACTPLPKPRKKKVKT